MATRDVWCVNMTRARPTTLDHKYERTRAMSCGAVGNPSMRSTGVPPLKSTMVGSAAICTRNRQGSC